ncbi:WD repeat-containing protein 25 [Sphaerodactylus townsendi]|uniref:WD repeat-containing protein 25 n=1 Tax=Sphaerodactylus townsendi TaxID=933632 RepID=UPI00202671A1|nr:WD repeat-containing protein 25 [Sphaerodactylus townsendi]XP_048342466.1 WD repeat-containing protein 25 [Sphaerodactylus townsendi]XP_048342467.1 WD repeat-containing protein 25 [Sphaerodactylus townsendi]XP_048342468.1 WD repeat-containing protein 25 [Sphaerodactylus townsendi]
MSSLVAYDDSDSETDTGTSEDALHGEANLASPTMTTVGSRSGFDAISERRIQSVDYTAGSTKNVFHNDPLLYHMQADKKSSAVAHPAALQMATCSPGQWLSSMQKPRVLSENENYSQKRAPGDCEPTLQGLRPYIPKRLRQEKDPKEGGDSANKSANLGVAGDGMSIEISKYIVPYIGSNYGVTAIPTSLVFHMSEHRDPVNVVRWCPVQKWGHMLLSASMDKTVKVWDAVDRGCCLKTYSCHSGAVRDVQWSSSGICILSGGFDSMLHLTDVETGAQVFSGRSEFRIGTLKFHPADPNVFICGGFSPEVKAWDIRMCKAIKEYKAAVQQTLDIMFLPEGKEFFTSTDVVSQDSADRTIMAWDFQTGAKISNQIFHERYTCPCLTHHPKDSIFVAQTNGNYMALFSSLRPYRINKRKRYEGHKVEGFAVGCEFSPDGTLLVTGSSEGKVFFYSYHTSRIVRMLSAHGSACTSATFNPVLPSLLATCSWDGEIKIWQ